MINQEKEVWDAYLKNKEEYEMEYLSIVEKCIEAYRAKGYTTRELLERDQLLWRINEFLEEENVLLWQKIERLTQENLMVWEDSSKLYTAYQELQSKWTEWQERIAIKERRYTTIGSLITFIGVAIGYQQKVVPPLRVRARSIKKIGWRKRLLYFLAGEWRMSFLPKKRRKKRVCSQSSSK